MCFLKDTIDYYADVPNLIAGTLVHYKCNDNNNCDGSFVQFDDFHPGTARIFYFCKKMLDVFSDPESEKTS